MDAVSSAPGAAPQDADLPAPPPDQPPEAGGVPDAVPRDGDAPEDPDLSAPPTGPPPDAGGVPDAVPPPDAGDVPDAVPRDGDAPPGTTGPPGSVDPPSGTDPPPPRAWIPLGLLGGVPVRVNVTVPMTTLLGGDEPGTLHGYGPIDPATARALALGGTWRRLVTDPLSGTVLDLGRTRYRPPTDLAELIRARDKTCFRPGCGAHADGCHLDHTIPAAHGGPTADTNLGPACTTDHTLKTLGDFYVRQIRPGVFDWLSRRTARTYRRETDGTTTPIHPRTGQSL
ncbi:HNH endonuclease signature motif containing protein, partial [Georgenia yuyongxinii]